MLGFNIRFDVNDITSLAVAIILDFLVNFTCFNLAMVYLDKLCNKFTVKLTALNKTCGCHIGGCCQMFL